MKYVKNKGNKILLILLFAISISLHIACDDSSCDDCLDLTSKNILVVDVSGANLLFGDQAIYNPENISISSADGELQPIFIDQNTNTIQFFLEPGITNYSLELSEDDIEIVGFELETTESDVCCGTKTISTNTILNGNEIDNSEVITIIK